jgi:nitrogen fixation/metabolism regulation signal transduction histidine kinase
MKNFRLNLIIKILLLTIVLAAGFYFFFQYYSYFPLLIMFILSAYIVYNMINYVDVTNRNLSRFLSSIKYSDFSQSFGSLRLGKSFNDLTSSFNSVMDEFRKTRNEKEEQYRYLQTVLRHINIGLFSFDQSGKFEFINNAARKILGITQGKSILTIDNLPGELRTKLIDVKPGHGAPIKIYTESDIIHLIVYATEFKMRDQLYKLVSIQNIQSELEEKELEAWQKLIKVLTHEIMNSVTPISSLASTVNNMLGNSGNEYELEKEQISDIREAVKTIEKRSAGLIDFVESYRNLTKIPKPNFEIILIQQLFNRIEKLLKNEIEKNEIIFTKNITPKTLELTADPSQIEQILINLILNSINALANCNDKRINLSGELSTRGKIVLKVVDNGPGIAEEIQEKIFIPFFSTKKDGSGIGLSLARQIMRIHGGNIRVTSKADKETIFSLIF